VLRRLFGTAENTELIRALWNGLLELDDAHRIVDLSLILPIRLRRWTS
jgi:hypothetical protein